MGITYTTATRNSRADATCALVDGGTLEFQTSGGVEVATCPLNNPAFGAAVAGVAALNVTGVTDASATGGTTTIGVFKNSGGTEKWRCTVGSLGDGTNIELTNTNVVTAGGTVTVASYNYTEPAS